ncbi:MAG: ATP-binding protein [Clostridia bacterium]|nr:ATP-binding protein [Clostridia bacterium]
MRKKVYKILIISVIIALSVAFFSCGTAYFIHRKGQIGAGYSFINFLGETFPFLIIYGVLILGFGVFYLHLCDRLFKPFKTKIEGLQEKSEYEELNSYVSKINSTYLQLKSAEAETQRSIDELKTISASMNQGLIILDNQGKITLINGYAESLIGMDFAMVKGQHYSITKYNKTITSLLKSASFGQVAERIVEEENVSYRFSLHPSKTYGEIKGYVLLILDVTDQGKLEALRREFTANVSHELKTPLHSISGAAELLCSGMVKQEDAPQFTNQIYQETKRMMRLVEDILKLSSLDENAENTIREDIDLLEIASSTINQLKFEADKKNIKLEVVGESLIVRCIKRLISAVIYNLCENAIKYNKSGGSVKISLKKKDNRAEIVIKDTGIGIPHEHQSRIFERFYRVDKSHSKEVGGTGLGLSIVKHAIKLHSGEIGVKSQVGKGTTFTIKLPIKNA